MATYKRISFKLDLELPKGRGHKFKYFSGDHPLESDPKGDAYLPKKSTPMQKRSVSHFK